MRLAFVKDMLWSQGDSLANGRLQPVDLEPEPTGQKKILVLSVSAGAGHLRAAQAICAQADTYGANITATHLDVMDYVTAGFRKLYTDFYIALISKHPAVWGYLYQRTNTARPNSTLQKFRRGIERLNTKKLSKKIALFKPDAIICTHFLPAEILAHMIRNAKLDCPVWVQVTDFDLHRMWVHEGMAGYFAANEEVACRMRALDIAPHRIQVTGIPIMPVFSQTFNRAKCARELNLDPERPIVMLMGGGAGLGSLEEVAERLLAMDQDFQLIVLAGRNLELLSALKELAARFPEKLLAQGYTDRVERLMASADFVITKPGGLTISECLAMGLPMIINAPIPGQEERNADFLLEEGVALKAIDAVTLEYRVRLLLERPEKLAEMRAKAIALGKPHAARQVVKTVLEKLTDTRYAVH